MRRIIYADNAATTRIDDRVAEKMLPYILDEYGNASQPYSLGKKQRQAMKEARETIANCIGALPEEIYFTSCGTESDNWAIKCFASKSPQRILITSAIEHHAVLNSCKAVATKDKLITLGVDSEGLVSCEELETELQRVSTENAPILVSIMTANNEIGTIQPIKELAKIAHSYGAVFHTDAVQAVGHIELNVNDLKVDMLSASAHKFNGPKGIGFLYVREGTELGRYIDGGSQEFGLRAGTENIASIVGMATALKINVSDIEGNSEFLLDLESQFIRALKESNIDFIRNGSLQHIPGNISISFKGKEGEMLLHRLDLKGICVSTGSACDSSNTRISHVIKAIKLDEQYEKGTIRISLGKNNTKDEVHIIASELIKILNDTHS